MNLNLSLEILKNKFHKSIDEIRSDLRYDMKNHKEE